MRKPARIAFAILFFAILGILAWEALRPPELTYKGESLTVWLQRYRWNPQPEDKQGALQTIGTNAIPVFLQMLRAYDPPLKLKLIDMAKQLRVLPKDYLVATERNSLATFGFFALGEAAEDAVPALIEIIQQNISRSSLASASFALVTLGPAAQQAIPLLMRHMTDTDGFVRVHAIIALGRIHAEPALVIPALIKTLNDPNAEVGKSAALALKEFGADAKPAVPALVHLLDGAADALVRDAASQTLKAIDPEAAAQAGVK